MNYCKAFFVKTRGALALSMGIISLGYCVDAQGQRVAVVGTGYVGLVTGACLAATNEVTCCDIDKRKIDFLNQGGIPIVEPGLDAVVKTHVQQGTLKFSSDVNLAIQEAHVIFIAVGTPMDDDGQADLSAVKAVAECIGRNLNGYKIVCTKSTVPIGTGALIRSLIEQSCPAGSHFDMVSNPEFLREGSAVYDFMNPDRLVLGVESNQAYDIMRNVYESFIAQKTPVVVTDIATSEAIKYASNAFLAVKISFINEFANLCSATGVDVITVAKAMGLDDRIGPKFLQPGPGYGGSCFPKDTQALACIANHVGVELKVVKAAIAANDNQRQVVIKKIQNLNPDGLTNKTVALLGLAFKPNTDDVRYSAAIEIIEYLRKEQAIIKAYDPAGAENMKKIFPDLTCCDSWRDAIREADVVVLVTDWDEFKKIDLSEIAALMHRHIMIDARNLWSPELLKQHGFVYENMGRQR